MNRKITYSIAVVLSVLLSVITFAPAQGQTPAQPTRHIFDTGLLTLGAMQKLRITVAANAGNDTIRVRFASEAYSPESCNGMICRHTVVSRSETDTFTIAPNEALSFDGIGIGFPGIRAMVFSTDPNMRVIAEVIDIPTGNVILMLSNPPEYLAKTRQA